LKALIANAIISIIILAGEFEMASISVRKLDEKTLSQLRVLAAKHGVSMEEEARQILKQAVSTPERLGDLAVRLFSPAYSGEDLELPEREIRDPLSFS
jgi:antitoxin FitA